MTGALPQSGEPALGAKRRFRLRLQPIIVGALGLGLLGYLIGYIGADAVFSAALAIGWGGFAILIAYAMALLVLLGIAWRALLVPAGRPLPTTFVWGRM